MMKRIKLLFWFFWLGVIGLAAWFAYYAVTPLNLQPKSQEITIEPKSSLRSVANQLVAQGVLLEPWRFILLAKIFKKEALLQSGNYTLNKNISPYQLLLSLNNGKTTQGSITFIEGRTFDKFLEKLAKNDAVKQTITGWTEEEILRFLGSEYKVAEGLFFPDTFYFDRGTTDLQILQRSYTAMQTKLERAWQNRAENLPYQTPINLDYGFHY